MREAALRAGADESATTLADSVSGGTSYGGGRGPRRSTASALWLRSARAHFNYLGLLAIAVVILLWQAAVQFRVITATYLPSPLEIARAIPSEWSSGAILDNTGHTVMVAVVGWLIATVLGLIVGSLVGGLPGVWRWTAASIEYLRAIPSVALLPLAVILFGFSAEMEWVLVVYGAQWMVAVATIDALRHAPSSLVDAGRILELSRFAIFRKIILPNAVPRIFVGVRLAMSLGLVLSVAAEILGNPKGLGAAITFNQESYRPAQTFLYLLLIGIVGICLNFILTKVAHALLGGIFVAKERS